MTNTLHATPKADQDSASSAVRQTLPLAQRRLDLLFVVFFLINLGFITYIVDFEQIAVPNAAHFTYPLWPPAPLVDLVHWWGHTFDPLLIARPPWWKATIWIDAVFFGPYYAAAIFAYLKGREWIRIPSLIWAAALVTNVTIILSEELTGPYATPQPLVVILANLPWLLVPLAVIARMGRAEHPFAAPVTE